MKGGIMNLYFIIIKSEDNEILTAYGPYDDINYATEKVRDLEKYFPGGTQLIIYGVKIDGKSTVIASKKIKNRKGES